jgi:hypothetical protein
MKPADFKQFDAIMVELAELYESNINIKRITLYFEALQEFELKDIIWASKDIIKECKYFPKPADFYERLKSTFYYVPPRTNTKE